MSLPSAFMRRLCAQPTILWRGRRFPHHISTIITAKIGVILCSWFMFWTSYIVSDTTIVDAARTFQEATSLLGEASQSMLRQPLPNPSVSNLPPVMTGLDTTQGQINRGGQFLLSRPPLKLVDTVFHIRSKPGDAQWEDPRKDMVDEEKEDPPIESDNGVDSKTKAMATKRLRLLERVTMHTKTQKEKEADARSSRLHEDKTQMNSRLHLWQEQHKKDATAQTKKDRKRGSKISGYVEKHMLSPVDDRIQKPSSDSAGKKHSKLRFVSTSTQISANGRATVGSDSGYIAPQEPESHDEKVKQSESSALMDAIEQSVKDSETLTNAEVIEHTGEQDPDNKDDKNSENNKETEDSDGPEEGGAGEKSPINKYYKWWSLSSWNPKLLEAMVNSPSHGQLNTDIGGKRSATNTHGDDTFVAEMADVTSGAAAAEGKGEADDKKEDGAVRFTNIKAFPAWTRKSEWLRTDANFAPGGIVPPTEPDQKEIEDAAKTQLPVQGELDDALDPVRTKQLMASANVGEGGIQDSLHDAMNQGAASTRL